MPLAISINKLNSTKNARAFASSIEVAGSDVAFLAFAHFYFTRVSAKSGGGQRIHDGVLCSTRFGE